MIYLESRDEGGLAPAVGLCDASASPSIHFVRDDSGGSRRLRTGDEVRDDSTAAVLHEVEPYDMPGIYRIDLPAELFESGSESLFLAVRGRTGGGREVEPLVLEFELVAYDPYDGVGIGLDGFTKAVRHQNLTSILVDIMPDSVRTLARERRTR